MSLGFYISLSCLLPYFIINLTNSDSSSETHLEKDRKNKFQKNKYWENIFYKQMRHETDALTSYNCLANNESLGKSTIRSTTFSHLLGYSCRLSGCLHSLFAPFASLFIYLLSSKFVFLQWLQFRNSFILLSCSEHFHCSVRPCYYLQ